MHGLQACLFIYITVAAFRIYLSVVKMPLKGEVGGQALKSQRNYIVDRGKSWKNHGIVFLNFPVSAWLSIIVSWISHLRSFSFDTECFWETNFSDHASKTGE